MAEMEELNKLALNVVYDFRLGLDLSKIVYRDRNQFNCREITIYLVIMVIFWAVVIAYYALWHHVYLNYIFPSFWCVVAFASFLLIVWLIKAFETHKAYLNRKILRKAKLEEELKLVELNKIKHHVANNTEVKINNVENNINMKAELETPRVDANLAVDVNIGQPIEKSNINLNKDIDLEIQLTSGVRLETQENKNLLGKL
jgi:hypothetical protein